MGTAMAENGSLTWYAGRLQPISGLSSSQLVDKQLWNKQMAALKVEETQERKKKAKEKAAKDKGGQGRYKRMELARLQPKTKVAEMLNILYDNQDPFLKALTRL